MFKKSKKEIKVENNGDYLLWKINIDDIPYDCHLGLEEDCIAYYFENGSCVPFKKCGEYIINQKKFGKNKKMTLWGAKKNARLVLKSGTSERLTYIDPTDRDKQGTTIGARVDIDVTLEEPIKILEKINDKNNITFEDIDFKLHTNLNSILRIECANYIESKSVQDIARKNDSLNNALKEKFDAYLNEFGLNVNICSVIFDYEDDYQEHIINSEAKFKKNHDDEKRREKEIEIIKEFNKETNEGNIKRIVCPFCKKEIDSNNRFCPLCGKKI